MTSIHLLKNKSDDILISDLKNLVIQERETLTEILNYLKELDERRLYLARGYPSLFAFITEELKYSESAAQRRIVAMRLIREVPEVEEKIERGEMSLAVASQLGTFFKQEGQKRREQKSQPITRNEKLALLNTLQGTSRRECERKLAALAPETILPKEIARPITEEKTLIQFTAGKALMSKIGKLKNLLSHQDKTGTLEELFEKLTDLALEKLDPERREHRRQQRESKTSNPKTNPIPPAEVKSRYIPQALRDKVWLGDQGRCQHRDPRTGKICGSRQWLEFDHRWPFALGGKNSEENLQLKCRNHNQFRTEPLFGNTGRERKQKGIH